MHSLRTRITFFTICVTAIAVAIVTLVSVLFIRNSKRRESEQMLLLLCETGQRNLDYYFNSVQQSMGKVSSFMENDLEQVNALVDGQLTRHIRRAEKYFDEMASKTNGVLTFYYRIDPEASTTVKGFWYTNLDGEGFTEHEVTDITEYDTEDTSKLVWFTVPKHTGKGVWLSPYITDNLDWRVISYNVPIYWRGNFIGVAGIEIDYSTMAEQVESIRLYENGYAFLNDRNGNLFYHPRIDVTKLTPETMPEPPEGLLSDNTFLRYTFEGVDREAAWLELCNGMRLNVSVPVSETEGGWQNLVREIIVVSLAVLLCLCAFTLFYTGRITRPLQRLTAAAEQVDRGNYDVDLNYDKDDEVGRLTSTFKKLTDNMKAHITDLNKRVYVDALTSVKNKGAFTDSIEKLQKQIDNHSGRIEFAVGVFDCDDLKTINDRYGHDKGDLYLKTACRLICTVFQHSPVFRIGGDEFSVILQNDDYQNREELILEFEREKAQICADALNPWEKVSVSMGIALYDPAADHAVIDVVRRADKTMYVNKRGRKKANASMI